MFYQGNFPEIPGDFPVEFPWKGRAPHDAWQNQFHYLSAVCVVINSENF
jgi:hypothetical protein